MAGQALHVFERDALFEQIRDGGDAEGMRREASGQTGRSEPPLHHAADVVDRETRRAEVAGAPQSAAEQGRVLRSIAKIGCVQVGK